MKTYLHAAAAMTVLFAIWYACDWLEPHLFPRDNNVLSTIGFFVGAAAAFAVVQLGAKKKA